TLRVLNPEKMTQAPEDVQALLRERDTLTHQIVLHLNPNDTEDQAIQRAVESVAELTQPGGYSAELHKLLIHLRNATSLPEERMDQSQTRVKIRRAVIQIPPARKIGTGSGSVRKNQSTANLAVAVIWRNAACRCRSQFPGSHRSC